VGRSDPKRSTAVTGPFTADEIRSFHAFMGNAADDVRWVYGRSEPNGPPSLSHDGPMWAFWFELASMRLSELW
jgi:hypothetical protein